MAVCRTKRSMAMNDDLAELATRYPSRIYGLASVDAYDGERSAREVERAIRELGLHGLLVECAQGDLLLDAPQARPTLEVAAELGVPVFAHPIAPQPLTRQMAQYGLIGTLFARGAVNSAALIALVEGEVFSDLPGLQVVFTAQAIGGLAMAAGLTGISRLPSGTIEVMRKNVFIDTTLFHPALFRAFVDLLGAGNVIAGSDWPVANDKPVRDMLMDTMKMPACLPLNRKRSPRAIQADYWEWAKCSPWVNRALAIQPPDRSMSAPNPMGDKRCQSLHSLQRKKKDRLAAALQSTLRKAIRLLLVPSLPAPPEQT